MSTFWSILESVALGVVIGPTVVLAVFGSAWVGAWIADRIPV